MDHSTTLNIVNSLIKQPTKQKLFHAYQLMFNLHQPCYFIENYLVDNENRSQSLDNFPMMRQIYNNIPQRLLLKCSRKTLKSTFLSNFIALNMVRWNNYNMMYVGPQELSVNYFSSNYVNPRFESPKLKRILYSGLGKWDIKEKKLTDTNSTCLFRYCSDDATRLRGPATDHNLYDEIQNIDFEQLPIIGETMTLSEYKKEVFSGTPLTTDNTIERLWRTTSQNEWMFKCTYCNHWNSLTPDNDPIKMIGLEGLLCSKCEKVISTRHGEWISWNPAIKEFMGYHLAQPILPFFNERPDQWKDVYRKVHSGAYGLYQVFNEVFGISYDIGAKPITEEELKSLCTLGRMGGGGNYDIYNKNRYRYALYSCGADWGISNETSRTASCFAALREDGQIDVWFCKIHEGFEYNSHVREIAELSNMTGAFTASDSGPSPDRGILLVELTSSSRTQLVRYEHGRVIQRVDISPDGTWQRNRWCLHRSDAMSVIFKLLKNKKINFPRWEDSGPCLADILNVTIEVREGLHRQELFYRHKLTSPDDFMHALVFAICQLLVLTNDPALHGCSSTFDNENVQTMA